MRKHTHDATPPVPVAATSGRAVALRSRRMIAALLAAIAVLLAAFATTAVHDSSDGVVGGGTELSASAATEEPQDDVAVLESVFGLGASVFGATWS